MLTKVLHKRQKWIKINMNYRKEIKCIKLLNVRCHGDTRILSEQVRL